MNNQDYTISDIFNAKIQNDLQIPMQIWSEFEFVCCLEGELQVTIEENSYEIAKGYNVIILPNQSRSYLTYDHSKCVVLSVSPLLIPDFADNVYGKKPLFPIAKTDDKNFILSFLEDMSIYQLKSKLYQLLSILENKIEFVVIDNKVSTFVNLMTAYIEENYSLNISLKQIAKEFGYDYHYMSSLFNLAFKRNFLSYLNEYRISVACQLLKEDNTFTITQIAYNCGFSSLRSFNRNFLEIMNMTPSQYQKK